MNRDTATTTADEPLYLVQSRFRGSRWRTEATFLARKHALRQAEFSSDGQKNCWRVLMVKRIWPTGPDTHLDSELDTIKPATARNTVKGAKVGKITTTP